MGIENFYLTNRILLIGLGGGVGSILRYLLSVSVYKLLRPNFPYGTLTVNALGSFLIGFLFVFLLDRFGGRTDQLRSLLIIGFLGGFTTFSSFSIETINLLENGEIYYGCLNIIISLFLCLSLTWGGIMLGRLV